MNDIRKHVANVNSELHVLAREADGVEIDVGGIMLQIVRPLKDEIKRQASEARGEITRLYESLFAQNQYLGVYDRICGAYDASYSLLVENNEHHELFVDACTHLDAVDGKIREALDAFPAKYPALNLTDEFDTKSFYFVFSDLYMLSSATVYQAIENTVLSLHNDINSYAVKSISEIEEAAGGKSLSWYSG